MSQIVAGCLAFCGPEPFFMPPRPNPCHRVR